MTCAREPDATLRPKARWPRGPHPEPRDGCAVSSPPLGDPSAGDGPKFREGHETAAVAAGHAVQVVLTRGRCHPSTFVLCWRRMAPQVTSKISTLGRRGAAPGQCSGSPRRTSSSFSSRLEGWTPTEDGDMAERPFVFKPQDRTQLVGGSYHGAPRDLTRPSA